MKNIQIETRGAHSYVYVVGYMTDIGLSFVSAQVRADSEDQAYAVGLEVGLEDELIRQGFTPLNSYVTEVH
jgi:Fe-S cluster assembly iron-binding protein IscA